MSAGLHTIQHYTLHIHRAHRGRTVYCMVCVYVLRLVSVFLGCMVLLVHPFTLAVFKGRDKIWPQSNFRPYKNFSHRELLKNLYHVCLLGQLSS